MSKRVTLEDVAEHAGVSRATASLVVRDSPLVAEATRKRVLASIDRLGYVYNRAAAALRTQRSQTVGLVVTDITNPFFAQMTVGGEDCFDAAAYALLLANTSDEPEKQARILQTMYARGVDGVLLCPARGTKVREVERLRRWGMPFVLVARYISDVDANYVGVDNEKGAALAVGHLIARGHRRIAFVGGPDDSSARRDRLKGYRHALTTHGLPFDPALAVTSPVSREGGYAAIASLVPLTAPAPLTAVVCYNDVVAFGVMLGLRARGCTPGDDVAVVGFDDIAEAVLWQPPLTTVVVGPRRIGEAAARLLLACIEDPERPVEQVIVAPRLVVRESSGRR